MSVLKYMIPFPKKSFDRFGRPRTLHSLRPNENPSTTSTERKPFDRFDRTKTLRLLQPNKNPSTLRPNENPSVASAEAARRAPTDYIRMGLSDSASLWQARGLTDQKPLFPLGQP
jgi:hypothetical protein